MNCVLICLYFACLFFLGPDCSATFTISSGINRLQRASAKECSSEIADAIPSSHSLASASFHSVASCDEIVKVADCSANHYRLKDAEIEAGCRYALSICAIFRQEARFLKEWIEFHKMMGVEHFYLFNNMSTDNYLEVLQPYIQAGEVDLIDWPSLPEKNWIPFQIDAYSYCVHQLALGVTRWLAIIDIDEFLLPLSHPTVIDFLREHERYGMMTIHWRYFGTSYLERIADDQLMIECLTHCHPAVDVFSECTYKSIVKPHRIQKVSVHSCYSRYGSYMANPGHDPSWYQGKSIPSAVPEIRINHYVQRDGEFLRSVKRDRRERLFGILWTEEIIQNQLKAYNEIEDFEILKWVPELRCRVFGCNEYTQET